MRSLGLRRKQILHRCDVFTSTPKSIRLNMSADVRTELIMKQMKARTPIKPTSGQYAEIVIMMMQGFREYGLSNEEARGYAIAKINENIPSNLESKKINLGHVMYVVQDQAAAWQ